MRLERRQVGSKYRVNDNNNNNETVAHAVIWPSRSVRAHPEINCDRIPVRAHAHARPPPIYPSSLFLLVSPRAVSRSAFHFFIFAHLKPCSRSFVRYLLSRFAKRKNDKRSSADTFETSWRINEVTGTFGQGFP